MHKKTLVAILLGALVALPGLATAHGDASDVNLGGTNYIVTHGSLNPLVWELWHETNGDPGLQTFWHCHPSGVGLPCPRGDTAIPPDSPGLKVP